MQTSKPSTPFGLSLSKALRLGAACLLAAPLLAFAAPDAYVMQQVQIEKAPYLQTLQELVSIESGSGDREGLDKISALIADKLKALGGKVEFIEPGADTYKMFDTPAKPGRMVHAQFVGTGTKKILLIAHMDTVYLRGMLANQPFKIDGNRAFGLGIADDKQGIAMILHTLAVLKANNFKDYGLVTVLINGDEEISSPASRNMLTKLGAEHDVTFSCEASLAAADRISLVTAGIGAVTLNVTGKASHAGGAPELGRNALYELSHQILQMRDLSDPATGVKFNWTISQAGTNRNVIPAKATAAADVRVLRVADFDGIEPKVAERIKNQLIPETKVDFNFERRRPPLQASPAGLAMANYAQKLYKEDLGLDLSFSVTAEGGGTDAAFAALKTQNAVLERFGARGFGAHSSDAEYILIDSIEPRMYLLSKMIMDVSSGKVK
jgi:glutamate carboxypeptidase